MHRSTSGWMRGNAPPWGSGAAATPTRTGTASASAPCRANARRQAWISGSSDSPELASRRSATAPYAATCRATSRSRLIPSTCSTPGTSAGKSVHSSSEWRKRNGFILLAAGTRNSWGSPCCKTGPVNRSKPELSDRSITAGSDFLQLDIGGRPRPAGGPTGSPQRLRLAIADGRLPVGQPAAAHPGAGRRPAGVPRRGHRGVPAARRGRARRRPRPGRHHGRGAGQLGASRTAAATPDRGPARCSAARRAPTSSTRCGRPPRRIDLSPGVPDLAAFPRRPGCAPSGPCSPSLSPTAFGYGDPRGTPALRLRRRDLAGPQPGHRGRRRTRWSSSPASRRRSGCWRRCSARTASPRSPWRTPVRSASASTCATWAWPRRRSRSTPTGSGSTTCARSGVAGGAADPGAPVPDRRGARRRPAARADRAGPTPGGLVIEDDYDAEHRYDRPPVPALRVDAGRAGLLHRERVQAAGAGAAGRLDARAAPRYRDALVAAKRYADLGNAVLPQLVLATLMESGELERQLRFVAPPAPPPPRRDDRRRSRPTCRGAVVHGAAAGPAPDDHLRRRRARPTRTSRPRRWPAA